MHDGGGPLQWAFVVPVLRRTRVSGGAPPPHAHEPGPFHIVGPNSNVGRRARSGECRNILPRGSRPTAGERGARKESTRSATAFRRRRTVGRARAIPAGGSRARRRKTEPVIDVGGLLGAFANAALEIPFEPWASALRREAHHCLAIRSPVHGGPSGAASLDPTKTPIVAEPAKGAQSGAGKGERRRSIAESVSQRADRKTNRIAPRADESKYKRAFMSVSDPALRRQSF